MPVSVKNKGAKKKTIAPHVAERFIRARRCIERKEKRPGAAHDVESFDEDLRIKWVAVRVRVRVRVRYSSPILPPHKWGCFAKK